MDPGNLRWKDAGEGRQGCGSGTTWKSIVGGFALEERGMCAPLEGQST